MNSMKDLDDVFNALARSALAKFGVSDTDVKLAAIGSAGRA